MADLASRCVRKMACCSKAAWRGGFGFVFGIVGTTALCLVHIVRDAHIGVHSSR